VSGKRPRRIRAELIYTTSTAKETGKGTFEPVASGTRESGCCCKL